MIRHLLTSVLLLLFTSIHAQVQLGNDMITISDQLPSSIEMPSPDMIAAGGYSKDFGITSGGYVRIYNYLNGEWNVYGNTLFAESSGDLFGCSISIPSDNLNFLAIGAKNNYSTNVDAGEVKFYSWNGSSWAETGDSLTGSNSGAHFGCASDMPNETTIGIGASGSHNLNGNVTGGAFIYNWNGSNWVLKGNPVYGEESLDNFGVTISMPDENTIAIGADYNDNANGTNAGKVYIYDWDGNDWILRGNGILGPGTNSSGGSSISMPTPNTIAIGASSYSNTFQAAGQVRIFDWNGSDWVQRGQSFEGEHDFHNLSQVSMPDSTTIALGGKGFDGSTYREGNIQIFKWNGSNWLQKGIDIIGETDHRLGRSIAMADTNRVGTCVPGFENTGAIQAYDFCASRDTDEVTGCKGYTWINGTTYLESNDTDFHLLSNSKGCDSIIYLDLTIYPDIGITNNSFYLMADAENATYQWLDCDEDYAPIPNEIQRGYFFNENGNYAVIVTQNGCTDTSECVNISDVSVPTLSKEHIKIFPNPTDGELYIKTKELTSVKVMDAMGRVIESVDTSAQSHTIDLSNQKQGVYIVQVKDSQKIRTYRVILK